MFSSGELEKSQPFYDQNDCPTGSAPAFQKTRCVVSLTPFSSLYDTRRSSIYYIVGTTKTQTKFICNPGEQGKPNPSMTKMTAQLSAFQQTLFEIPFHTLARFLASDKPSTYYILKTTELIDKIYVQLWRTRQSLTLLTKMMAQLGLLQPSEKE